MYLPLDVPGALAWYVNTVYPANSLKQRLFESLLRAVTGLETQRFARLSPLVAVTARRTSTARASVLGSAALPKPLQESELRPVLFTDAGNRVTLLPFTEKSKEPVAVLKIPKLPTLNQRTENEQRTLTHVRARLDSAVRASVPEPLGILSYGHISVSMESYLPGTSLVRSSGRWGAPFKRKLEDLRLAAEWLTEFHGQTQIRRSPWGALEISEWIEEPLELYRERFGLTIAEEHLFSAFREQAESLVGVPLPFVWWHRDFNVWNIHRDGRKLNVIDWEGGRPGPPLCDLLHFVTYWNKTARHIKSGAPELRSFRRLFLNPPRGTLIARAIDGVLDRYLERLGIDRRFLPLLLVYTWVELALRRYDQQRDKRELQPAARAGNQNLSFIHVLAEDPKNLFQRDAWL